MTIFEALPVAGGMLRVGVPEYRLPAEIIDREVADILDLGIELRLNTMVEDLDEVFDEGFDAVLIAVGAHEGIRLPIPGADLDGVLINTRFLRDVRLGNLPPLGEKVLVLGGGNVAIDCARTAVRLGAEVHLACLESRQGMPCHPWEADAAEEEGVTIHPDRSFLRIVADENGRAAGVECAKVAHFEFDHEGRLSVETEPGSEHLLEADTVIFSVGQRAGLAFIPDDAGVGITRQRTIAINPNTMAATRPGVFAAGDSVSGTAFVIEAVASGHKAAEAIHRYLQGEDLELPPKPELPVVKFSRAELQQRVLEGELRPKSRVPMQSFRRSSAGRTSRKSSAATPMNWPRRRPPVAWPAPYALSAFPVCMPAAGRPSITIWWPWRSRSGWEPSCSHRAIRSTRPNSPRNTG